MCKEPSSSLDWLMSLENQKTGVKLSAVTTYFCEDIAITSKTN